MNEHNLRRLAARLPMLLCGAAILAFGLFNVHSRSQITEGGVLGMSLLLHHWFGISPGICGPIMDMACYLLGLRLLGRGFLVNAMIASGGFAVFYGIFERMGAVLPNLSEQPLLASILGGLFVGVGVGLVVRAGGASGGDDALALVIAKLTGWGVSRAYLFTDIVVLLLSLSYLPVGKIIYSLLTVTISSLIIGKIHTGGQNAAEANT